MTDFMFFMVFFLGWAAGIVTAVGVLGIVIAWPER